MRTPCSILVVCTVALAAQDQPAIAALGWMAGNWTGAAGRAAVQETWIPPAGGAMLGLGRTIASSRMVGFEFLRIVEKDGGIFYIAQPNGRPPTEFRLTSVTNTKAVFENSAHDHPKIITYELGADGGLHVSLEGDEGGRHKRQRFQFRPANN